MADTAIIITCSAPTIIATSLNSNLPAASDIRKNVVVGNLHTVGSLIVGTCHVPVKADVRLGTAVDVSDVGELVVEGGGSKLLDGGLIQLSLDIAPAYISFEFQSAKVDGRAIDPAGTPTLTIYEEAGGDGAYDNTQVAGSPFNLAKINAQTGNYGVLLSKSLFTAGKIYRCIYVATVDGLVTRNVKLLLACNASQFKATGFAVPGDAMSLTPDERTAVANAIEAEIIDDTDSEKVLQAIIDKIASANPDLSGLTLGAIASAIRTELTTELARIDGTITSRATQASVDAIPTNPLTDKIGFALTSAYDAAKTAAQAGDNMVASNMTAAPDNDTIAIIAAALVDGTIGLAALKAAIVAIEAGASLEDLAAAHGAGQWGASIMLPAMQGQVYTAINIQKKDLRIVRGDGVTQPIDLLGDYTGWVPWFAAKVNETDTEYHIEPVEAVWIDAAKGQMYVDLNFEAAGRFYGEIELRKEGSLPLTVWKVIITVLQDIIV